MSADEDRDGAITGDLRALREVKPPPALVASVMERISREPPPAGFWRWLGRARRVELRLSPLGAAGVLVSAAVLASGLAVRLSEVRRISPPLPVDAATPAPAAVPGASPVLVRFALSAAGARRVAVAGDFNAWDTGRDALQPVGDGSTFAATLPLPPGTHEYMFVVDGRWVTDPTAESRRPDGFGRENAILRL